MQLLVLGGTGFVSRTLVELALASGHRVTTFSRGISGIPPPGADWIRGDRRNPSDLGALSEHRFDAVFDFCQQSPTQVALAASLLADRVSSYVFFSSMSVYADFRQPGMSESARLRSLPSGADEDGAADYGALKARCEQLVRQLVGSRALVLRPCLVAGMNDPSDRFGYWPSRIASGGGGPGPPPPPRHGPFLILIYFGPAGLHAAGIPANGGYKPPGAAHPPRDDP